ncbi:MAG: O-antigen ligase family protein, partial [Cyanobacteria bacterium REEB65]|nr:O-antigen ligase family protein [Cyanobacteria bacterium REEB65]
IRLAWDSAGKRDWARFRSPLTLPVLVLAAYLGLEVLNPLQPSIAFGLYGSRDTLRLLGFFLALAYLRQAVQIRRFLGSFAFLCLAEGAYGIWQHQHGLLYQEYNWLITSMSYRTHILFGYIRIFGTLGDAATYGFLEVSGTLLLLGLALTAGPRRAWLLAIGIAGTLYAMVLSYSRGPMVAVAAGGVAIVTASRSVRLALAILAMACGGWVVLTHLGDSRLAERILTATHPTDDPSYQVREGYVHEYLPRILAHPFGTGLYTAGASGLLVTHGHYIPGTTVGVPTDNQYFKYALELGWAGLALFTWLIVGLCWHTFHAYLGLKDPALKAWALGLLGVFACYAIGAASNDILVQKPLSEWFWIAAGIAMRLWQLAAAQTDLPACGEGPS